MALDFPSNPVVGQTFNNYVWTGTAWAAQGSTNNVGTQIADLQAGSKNIATYANAVARDAAITSPVAGAQAYLSDVKQVTVYNGSIWKSDMAGLVPMVPTTVAVSGGTATANSLGLIEFTSVSSISLNNVFSSTYRSYRIIADFYNVSTTAVTVIARLRAAGVDFSGANYHRMAQNVLDSGTSGPSAGTNATSFTMTTVGNGTNNGGFVMDIEVPAKALRKSIQFSSTGFSGGVFNGWFGAGAINSTVAYDGFSLVMSGGTCSGSIQVLGYNS